MGRTVEIRRTDGNHKPVEYGPIDPYARIRELSVSLGRILQDGDMDPSIIVDVSLDNSVDPCIYLYGNGTYSIERNEDDRQKAHITTVLIEYAKIKKIQYEPKTVIDLFVDHLVEQHILFAERAVKVKNRELWPFRTFFMRLVGKPLYPVDD